METVLSNFKNHEAGVVLLLQMYAIMKFILYTHIYDETSEVLQLVWRITKARKIFNSVNTENFKTKHVKILLKEFSTYCSTSQRSSSSHISYGSLDSSTLSQVRSIIYLVSLWETRVLVTFTVYPKYIGRLKDCRRSRLYVKSLYSYL